MPAIFGRERELAAVEVAVRRGLEGQGALLLLNGEPGIGKTLLAEHAARLAADAGATVAWGRCWEAGGAPAYWPWIQAFRGLELADPFLAAEGGESPADARFRAFDRAVRCLLERAKQGPVAVVLDDLHAADLPSLQLLQLLARGLRGAPLLVVGTYREVEARRDREAGPLLAKLGREAEVLALARLSPPDIQAWLAQAQQPGSAADLHRLTEGNPLFVREVLRLGGSLDPERALHGIGPVLDEHLSRVSESARALLEQAAIFGREVAAVELGLLSGASAAEVQAALGEAQAADLLSPAGHGRFSFVHILVRDRLLEQLPSARRAQLHWRAAEAILQSRADLISAAHHFIEGSAAGSVERVLEVVRDAAERCLHQLAFEAAADLSERALALVSVAQPSHAVCSVLVVSAEAYLRLGDLGQGKARCTAAAEMAKALGEPSLLARAALAYGAHFATASVDPIMVELLENALAALSPADHPIRARVMARLSSALVPPKPEDADRVLQLGREGIAMARRLGDPETLLFALQFGGSGFGYMIPSDGRLAILEEVVQLSERLGNRTAQLQMLGAYAAGLREEGRRAEALLAEDKYLKLLDHFPQPTYQWRRHAAHASLAMLEGDGEAARAAAQDVLRAGTEGGVRTALLAWGFIQVALAHAFGEPRSLAPHAEQVLRILSAVPTLAPYTAWVLAAMGRDAEARHLLETVVADPRSFPWLIAAADAALLLRAEDLAGRYYETLLAHRFTNRIFWGPAGATCLGPTERLLGDLAVLLGRPADAVDHYQKAIQTCERVGAKPLLALSRAGLERARQALGSAGAGSPTPAPLATAAARVAASGQVVLRREGELWALERDGSCLRLKDGKGLRYLERLLEAPGQDVHVLELIGSEERPADAGALLDAKAKEQYRRRLEDLKDQLEEATRLHDSGRAERAQAEVDAIADALASAVGLGGRDRNAASNVERARINVQRRLRDVLERIAEQDPAFGRYLGASVHTGTYCSFRPV